MSCASRIARSAVTRAASRVADAELRLGEEGEEIRLEVCGERKCLRLLEGLPRGSWILGGEMGAPEREARRRLRERAPGTLGTLQRLAGVPESAVRRIAGVLVGKDVEHEGPARDLPLAELARLAQPDFEIGDAGREPPHLDLRPAAARARPDQYGETHPLQTDVRIVTGNLQGLVEQPQRAVEAARGDVDVSEIGVDDCAQCHVPQRVGESDCLLPDLGSLGELAGQPVGRHQGVFDVQSTARITLARRDLPTLRAKALELLGGETDPPRACSSMTRARSP